jgi:hypothetical protein
MIKDLLDRLVTYQPSLNFSFHPTIASLTPAGEKKELDAARIIIIEAGPFLLRSRGLWSVIRRPALLG